MAVLQKIRIDVTKIDKARIFEGKKGRYLNLDVWVDEDKPDQFGNTIQVFHEQTKEERGARADRIDLGQGKVWWKSPGAGAKAAPKPEPSRPMTTHELADDIAF